LSKPSAQARQVLTDLGISKPAELRYLKEICAERGAFVREEPLGDCDGRLVIRGNRGVITVRPAIRGPGRLRFSVAHELGHFELHRERSGLWVCALADPGADQDALKRDSELEPEANEFAAELLMPRSMLEAQLRGLPPDLAMLKDLAQLYQVSLSAMATRYMSLTDRACAVIFFKKGAITSVWPSRLFGRQGFWVRRGKLHPSSQAHRAYEKGLSMSVKITVSAGVWLRVGPEHRFVPIEEQSAFFPGAGLGLALITVPGVEEF